MRSLGGNGTLAPVAHFSSLSRDLGRWARVERPSCERCGTAAQVARSADFTDWVTCFACGHETPAGWLVPDDVAFHSRGFVPRYGHFRREEPEPPPPVTTPVERLIAARRAHPEAYVGEKIRELGSPNVELGPEHTNLAIDRGWIRARPTFEENLAALRYWFQHGGVEV